MNLVTIMQTEDQEKLLLKVFDCLIDTVQNVTDLENVYSSGGLKSVNWAEVYEARKFLGDRDDYNER